MTRKVLVFIVALLILLWIVGLVFKIAGAAIHFLVIVAVGLVIAGFSPETLRIPGMIEEKTSCPCAQEARGPSTRSAPEFLQPCPSN